MYIRKAHFRKRSVGFFVLAVKKSACPWHELLQFDARIWKPRANIDLPMSGADRACTVHLADTDIPGVERSRAFSLLSIPHERAASVWYEPHQGCWLKRIFYRVAGWYSSVRPERPRSVPTQLMRKPCAWPGYLSSGYGSVRLCLGNAAAARRLSGTTERVSLQLLPHEIQEAALGPSDKSGNGVFQYPGQRQHAYSFGSH